MAYQVRANAIRPYRWHFQGEAYVSPDLIIIEAIAFLIDPPTYFSYQTSNLPHRVIKPNYR